MTPVEVLTNIREGRVDQRTLRHAVRLRQFVEVFGTYRSKADVVTVEKTTDYAKALEAQSLVYRMTRRGESILAQKT